MPVLYVDSNYRSAGSPTDFTIELRDSLVIERHAMVRLDQCRVPLSMYTVNDTNKYLYITESPSAIDIQPRLITLQKQNYSGEELAAEVQKQLNSGGPFVQNRGAGYSVSYNANQGSLTLLKLPSAKYPLITNDNKYLYILSWSRVTLTNLFVAIELTPGPYTTSLLVEELQRKMNAAENPYGIANPWTVTCLENEGLIQVTPAPAVAGLADWCFVPDSSLANMDLAPFGFEGVTSANPKSANSIIGVTEMQLVSTWVSTRPLDLPDDPETFTVHTDEDLRSGKVILRRLAFQPEPMFTEDSCYMYGLWCNAATGKLQFPKFKMPVGIRTYDPPNLAIDIAAVLENTATVFDTVALGGVTRHVYTVNVLQSGKLLVASTDRTETNQLAFLDDETLECLANLPEIKKDTNDRLYLQRQLLDQSFAYGITLNPGFYTIGQLVVEMDRALNAVDTVFKNASIPRPFIVTAQSGFLKLSLANEVPNSLYSDSSTQRIRTNVNDKLYLRCSFGSLDYHYLIVVPPGVYTSGQWCAMLEDKLNAATTVFASPVTPRPFTAFKYLGKIRVVVTAPAPANSKFTFFPDSFLTPAMLQTFQVTERQSANIVMGNTLFTDSSLTWTAETVYYEPVRKISLVPDNMLNYPQVSHITSENNRLYLMCAIGGTTYKYGLYLSLGIYTSGEFAVMLEDKLNAAQTVFASTLVPRPWSVVRENGKIRVLLVTYAQSWSFTFLTDSFLAQSPLILLQQTWFNDVTPTNLRSANAILGNITDTQGMVVSWLANTVFVEPAIKHAPSDFFPLATYETLNSANNFIGNSFGLLGGVYTLDRTWMAARVYEEPVFTPRMLSLSLLLANITSNNNRLYFQMTYSTSLVKYLLVTFPPGWYTIERFASFLQTYLNSAQTPYNKPGRVDPFQVRISGGYIYILIAESTTDPMDNTELFGIIPDSYFPQAARLGLDFAAVFGVTVDPNNPKSCNAVMGNTATVYRRYRASFFAWEPFQGPPPITREWWCKSLKGYNQEWAPQTAEDPKACNAQLGNTLLRVTGRTWIADSPITIPPMTFNDTRTWLAYAGDASSDQPRSFNRNLHHPGGTVSTGNSFTSKFVSLQIDDIYIHSDILDATNSHGPKQESDIIHRVPVTLPYGHIMASDNPQFLWHSVGPLSRRRLSFRVTDVDGNVLDLGGLGVSFTLSIEDEANVTR